MITSYSSHSEYLSQVIVDINTRHQSTIVEKNITIHDVVIEGDIIMPPNFTSIFNMTPSISDIEIRKLLRVLTPPNEYSRVVDWITGNRFNLTFQFDNTSLYWCVFTRW